MLSERVNELNLSKKMSHVPSSVTVPPHKPFHRPGFPAEFPSVPSPADRRSCPTSPSSPCSTTSEHDSSPEKAVPTDSDHSDEGDRGIETMDYYRTSSDNIHDDTNTLDNGVRRYRTAFNKEQINMLEREFTKENYVSRPKRCELAKQLNLPESTIKVWFQNRRMKDKRQRMAVTWPYGIPPDPQIYAYLAAAAASYPYALPNPGALAYPSLGLPSVYPQSPSSAFSPLTAQGPLKPRMDMLPPGLPTSMNVSPAALDRLSPPTAAPLSRDTGRNLSQRYKADPPSPLNGLSGGKHCPCGLPTCSLSNGVANLHPALQSSAVTSLHPALQSSSITSLHPALQPAYSSPSLHPGMHPSFNTSLPGLLSSSYGAYLSPQDIKH